MEAKEEVGIQKNGTREANGDVPILCYFPFTHLFVDKPNKIFISKCTFHGCVKINICNCSFGQDAIKLLK